MKKKLEIVFLALSIVVFTGTAYAQMNGGGNSQREAKRIDQSYFGRELSEKVDYDNPWYYIEAAKEGTYYFTFWNVTDGPSKWPCISVELYNNGNKRIYSEGVKEGEYIVAEASLNEGERVYLKINSAYMYGDEQYCMSICTEGAHKLTNHSEVTKKATCIDKGERTVYCELCLKGGRIEEIPAVGHTLGDWQKERNPGCVTTGLNAQRCTVCGEIVNQQEIPAIGHGSSKQIVTQPATCMATGVMSEQCTVCLETLATQTLPITDHTLGIMKTVMPASCTMNGRGEQRCTVCNALLKEETTTAYGHSFSEWETIVEATKQSEGQKMRYCYNCANIEYEKIEKLPKFMGIF